MSRVRLFLLKRAILRPHLAQSLSRQTPDVDTGFHKDFKDFMFRLLK